MTKNSRQKFKSLENKKRFQREMKSTFHHFKGSSVAKFCFRPESAPLKEIVEYSSVKVIPKNLVSTFFDKDFKCF